MPMGKYGSVKAKSPAKKKKKAPAKKSPAKRKTY